MLQAANTDPLIPKARNSENLLFPLQIKPVSQLKLILRIFNSSTLGTNGLSKVSKFGATKTS